MTKANISVLISASSKRLPQSECWLGSFSGSLATKCMSLINKPCMIRPTLVDLNHVDLNYYPFMISLDKFNGSCDALMTFLQKYVFQVKQVRKY